MPIPRPAYNEFAPARAKHTPYEPPTDLPTLSYRQVLDMYDEDRKDQPVFSQMTLPEYAQYQNQLGKSQMFDQALTTGVGGLIKRAAAEKSKFIESPAGVYGLVSPAAGLVNQYIGSKYEGGKGRLFGGKSVPEYSQQLAQSLSAPLGEHWSEVIGQAAQGLPESLVNVAPMVSGVGALGTAATAALSGAGTYEQTGSKLQGLLSAGTAAAIPTVFGRTAQAGLSAAGATLRNETGQLVGETLGQRAAGYGAGQLGAAGLMEFSHQTGQIAAGNGPDSSAEHFVQSAIGQLPFLALDLPNLINGGQIANAIKAKNSTAERARQAEEYNLSIDQGGFRLSRNEEDARREGDRRTLQPDFQDLQVPPIQQSVYAPEFGNVDRPAVTGQPSEGSPEAAGEWSMPSKTGPEPQRGKLLSRNEVDELKAQGEGDAVKSGKYEPAYDKTLFGEKLPSVKTPEQDRTHYGTIDKPVAKPGGGAGDYTPDWQVGQTQEGKRVSTSEVLARQVAGYDQSKVEPKPLTPQVTESVIKPLLSETDSATAIKKIKGVYEAVLKPEFGVHDVVLSKLTDESLQQQILSHLQEGSGLNDAVLKTTQGIRNALAEAATKTEGKIITPEVKSIFVKIKAKQGQQMGSFPDVSIIGDYAEIGYHIARNLLKAGALKLSEWRDAVVQTFKTEGIDLDDSQLSQLEQRMRSMLASEDSGDGDTLHTAQRARLTKSVENLNHLNEPALNKVTLWRNDILERNEKFSKYPEVDESILTSAGRLQHNGQTWVSPEGKVYSDVQAKRYLRTSADLAYKAATKKEQGGQEVAYDEVQSEQGGVAQKKLDTFKDLNEANVRADELNKAVPANADYSYEGGIQGRTTKTPKYVVYKTYKKRESLDENFRPSREQPDETDKLITDKEAVPTGEESDPTREGTNLDESLYKTTEEGEAIDPLEEIESIGDKVRASSDESSGDVVQQHLSDVFNSVLGRLDPIQLYLEGQVRKPGELVARTKLMVQHLMDARIDLDAKGLDWSKFVAEANPKLAEEFKFQSDKQANNWWNGTGREFFKSWISKQPEIKSILGGKKAEAESVGTGPSVAEATKALTPRPDEVRLDAVSEARTNKVPLPFVRHLYDQSSGMVRAGDNVMFKFVDDLHKIDFLNEISGHLGESEIKQTENGDVVVPVKSLLEADGHETDTGLFSRDPKTFGERVAEQEKAQIEYNKAEGFYPEDFNKHFDDLVRQSGLVYGTKMAEARITTTDFLRSYFSRRGLGPELSQRSTDAVQKLARAAAFFQGSEKAKVELSDLGPETLGRAASIISNNAWRYLIQLNTRINSDSFMSVVAAHESFEVLLHGIRNGEITGPAQAVKDAISKAGEYTYADRDIILRQALSQLPTETRNELHGKEFAGLLDYSAADPKEFVATLAGIHVVDSTTKGGIARFADTLLYGDGYISRALNSIVNTAKSLINAFKGVSAAGSEGLIYDLPASARADLKHFNDLFKTVRNSEKTIQDAVSKLTTIDALRPESFWNAVNSGYLPDVGTTGDKALDSGLSEAYARILPKGDEREIGRIAGFASDFAQLAEVHETLRPILGEMLDYQALANDAARNAMSPFYTRDYVRGQTVLGEASKSLQAISKSTKLRGALSDQILSEQHLGRLLNQTELQSHWLKHSLDPNERTAIREVRQALSDANVIVGQQIVRQASESITHSVARILMSGSDTPYKNALQAADRLVTVGKAQSGLAQLPGGVDPTSLILSITRDLGVSPEKLTVAQMALGDMLGKYSALVKSVSDRPEFVSEQRFGRYAASYQLQGEKLPGRVSADSRTELETKIKSLQSGGKLIGDVQRFDNSDQTFTGLRPDIVRAFKDIGEAAYQRVAATQSREVADGMRNGFSGFDSAIEKELSARGIARYTQQRRLAPGREQLDMLENGMRYLSTVPRALAKTWLRDRSEVALLDPTMVQNPSAQKQAKQQVQNVLATESGWAAKAKNWSFLYYLGSNLSSALVEQIQPLLAVPAQLTKFGAGIGQGYKYLASAYKTVGEAYLKDRFSDPFVDNMISQLDKGHILEQQTIGNFFDNNDLNGINLSRATDGKLTPLSLYEAGKNQAAHVGGLARTLYSRATGLSSRVTAVAASLHAKDLIADGSLAPADAFDYVRRVVTLTAPGSAGRAGRPTGPYSGEETRSAVGVLLSLQGYTNTMYSMFARLGHDAIKSGSLTSASSKAFMQLGATQLLAAGVLGLPGVGLAINVVNAAFPQLNLKSNLRTGISSLAGDDAALGGLFSDVTLRGVPSTLTGVDLSSRLSLANMLGVSDYDGFQMGHLLGAPGGILTNMYRASQFAAQGQFGEAIETAAPTAIKNVLKVFRDGGDVRKPDGSITYQPSTGEQFAQLIGFTPKKVADMREFNTLAAQQEKTYANEQQRFISRTADLLRSGDLASVRSALLEREHANPDEFSAAEGLKLVVRQMQDQTYPEDPRRGGSKLTLNDRADLLRTYGPSGVAPSEQQRVVQQAHLLQQFGLVGSLDQSDIMKAGYVDLLMQKNPQMTRQQARKKVEEMTRRKPLPTLGGF